MKQWALVRYFSQPAEGRGPRFVVARARGEVRHKAVWEILRRGGSSRGQFCGRVVFAGQASPSEPLSDRNLLRSERCPILITAAKRLSGVRSERLFRKLLCLCGSSV